jgi:hypothetical protein
MKRYDEYDEYFVARLIRFNVNVGYNKEVKKKNDFKFRNIKEQMFRFELPEFENVNSAEENVEFVIFDIGYYGRHKWNLKVMREEGKPVSRLEAIRCVEEWFSKPLTEEYFEMVLDDTTYSGHSQYSKFENVKNNIKCRGDILGDKKSLSSINFDEDTSTLHLEFDI